MTTARELMDEARHQLVSHSHRFALTREERNDVRRLMAHVLGREPDPKDQVSAPAVRRFRSLVARRATGEPMAYIVGKIAFRDLELSIASGGFVPRMSTEFLAEQAIRRLRRRPEPVAVDLATGIGPVPLSIAKTLPHARVHGVDIASSAVKQARHNARQLGLSNARFHVGDLFAPLPKSLRADVVTMHPPYVARHQVSTLPIEMRRFEPRESLTDRSDDGMWLVRRVVDEGPGRLTADGWLLIEVARDIARPVRSLLTSGGYRDVRSTIGPIPYTRVLVGRAPTRRTH